MSPEPIQIGGVTIAAGERATVDLPVARLHTHTEIQMPVHVVHGARPGPVLFVSAALHGDEINGVEIIRRLLRLPILKKLAGTLLAIPVVNVFGLLGHSRYLPDRRDLNRSFPGSEGGSLAARLADLVMTEVVAKSTHGIDLHTGGVHRTNLPQARCDFKSEVALEVAMAFGAPVVLHAALRDGSLRKAATERGVPVVLYEAGEALRFDEWAIRHGLLGVVSAMQHLQMIPLPKRHKPPRQPLVAEKSHWVRAQIGGVLRPTVRLGDMVARGQIVGAIGDPFGREEHFVRADRAGMIVGQTNLPLVNEGDALFLVALVDETTAEFEAVDPFDVEHGGLALDPSAIGDEPT